LAERKEASKQTNGQGAKKKKVRRRKKENNEPFIEKAINK
jgi:hypothetical protein